MPLPFSLPQRPSLPSLTWSVGSPTNSADGSRTDDKTPKSAPPRTSQSSSSVASSIRRLSGSRSIKHTSIVVSRPTTPANPSPLSAAFGLPGCDEDDPFGVLALQKAGLHIKEAGTNNRPGSEAFQYRPAPSSPIWRSSMASAMSRASRPSFEGRSSIMTGRATHSRHGSTGTVATVATADMSTQTLDHEPSDQQSLREMSPVREASHSRHTSPKGVSSRSPDSSRKSTLAKPDSLLLNDHELKLRDETPSPRSRLAVVDEDAQEDLRKEENEASAKASILHSQQDEESDLDRLARELREMADEHEQETRKSREEEEKTKRADSMGDAETLAGEEDGEEAKTPQRLSVKSPVAMNDFEDRSTDPIPVDDDEVKSDQREALKIVSDDQIRKDNDDNEEKKDEEASEDDEDDDDDDDDDDADYDSFDDEEEPVIIEEAFQTAAPVNLRPRNLAVASLQARAQIVSVHLPPPPKIPSRNPRRTRQSDSAGLDGSDIHEEEDEYSPSSSHDNDSTSTYSLERDRDSFDDGQDIMTQTSQGSDAGSTEVTPTRAKAFDSLSGQVERGLSDRIKRLASDASKGESPALDEDEEKEREATTSQPQEPGKAPTPALLETPAPTIPERRRPFSFEAIASEEDLSNPSMDSVVKDQTHKSINSGRASPMEIKQTSGEPIRIPKLPEDDQSIYEEDYS